MQYISLGLSILSLLIAGAALYFSQLRRAKIKSFLVQKLKYIIMTTNMAYLQVLLFRFHF